MFQSQVSFESPLSPDDFCSEAMMVREQRTVFSNNWLFVGCVSEVQQSGQYLSVELAGVPILVRNFEGQLKAFLNVCSHRHCSLVTAARGRTERLKCPYHGWEFGSDGRTRRIPAAQNFPGFDREKYRLTEYAVETCGDLIFVRLTTEGPSLQNWLGGLYERIREITNLRDLTLAMRRDVAISANWKIPVEASLESYHIPEVHPTTFGEDPGEGKSDHEFGARTSTFRTCFNTSRWMDRLWRFVERVILVILGIPYQGRYEHHHVMPNLLISHTDSLTLIQTVSPTGAMTSASVVWQYRRRSSRSNPVSRMCSWGWGKFTSFLTWQILQEDIRMFPVIQRGEKAARSRSILGRCEERLHFFESFVADQVSSGAVSSDQDVSGKVSERGEALPDSVSCRGGLDDGISCNGGVR
jgi:choline monooxygenase